MQLRWVMMLAYLGVVIVVIVLQIFDPALSGILFWGLLLWLIASFFIYRLPIMNRPVGWGTSGAGASTSYSTTPTPRPPPTAPVDLGFCMYCGTHIPAGSSTCPSCGRTILPV
jgi:hypothetical protein